MSKHRRRSHDYLRFSLGGGGNHSLWRIAWTFWGIAKGLAEWWKLCRRWLLLLLLLLLYHRSFLMSDIFHLHLFLLTSNICRCINIIASIIIFIAVSIIRRSIVGNTLVNEHLILEGVDEWIDVGWLVVLLHHHWHNFLFPILLHFFLLLLFKLICC